MSIQSNVSFSGILGHSFLLQRRLFGRCGFWQKYFSVARRCSASFLSDNGGYWLNLVAVVRSPCRRRIDFKGFLSPSAFHYTTATRTRQYAKNFFVRGKLLQSGHFVLFCTPKKNQKSDLKRINSLLRLSGDTTTFNQGVPGSIPGWITINKRCKAVFWMCLRRSFIALAGIFYMTLEIMVSTGKLVEKNCADYTILCSRLSTWELCCALMSE